MTIAMKNKIVASASKAVKSRETTPCKEIQFEIFELKPRRTNVYQRSTSKTGILKTKFLEFFMKRIIFSFIKVKYNLIFFL